MRAVIFGCAGTELTPEEIAFFQRVQPWGFILFARNCKTLEQIKALTASMRDIVDREDAPILIDQEGGRVARLRPPLWRERPPMERFGQILERDGNAGRRAAFLGSRLIAEDLAELGINVNCVPVLDVPQPDAHDIIGDRALSKKVDDISTLGQDVIDGSIAGGVLPIIKHIPGHGRALADSHLELPIVDATLEELQQTDFEPFRALNNAPMAMTAHVVYTAIDPERPATHSSWVIQDIIREYIGFDGLLMSDDLSMKALGGSFGDRSRRSIEAGCDMLLHCNGVMTEMSEIALAAPTLAGDALRRAKAALALLHPSQPIDREADEATYAELLKTVAV